MQPSDYQDITKYLADRNAEQERQIQFLEILDETIPEELDDIVTAADEVVWEQVDCTACAHCCKTMTPYYKDEDIVRIAAHLNLSIAEFKEQYLEFEEETEQWVHDALPCVFLKDNLCEIYEVRPLDCREFPHHDKRPFDKWTDTYKQNVKKCPATYDLVGKVMGFVQDNYEGFETN